LRDVRFGIDVKSESDAHVTAEIAFEDAAAASHAQPWLARGVADLRERMEPSGLSASATDAVDGHRVRVELELSGLETAFVQLLEAKERRRDR
jgi:hypothetical protein